MQHPKSSCTLGVSRFDVFKFKRRLRSDILRNFAIPTNQTFVGIAKSLSPYDLKALWNLNTSELDTPKVLETERCILTVLWALEQLTQVSLPQETCFDSRESKDI